MILASVLLHLASLGPAEPATPFSGARAGKSIYDESPLGPGVEANVPGVGRWVGHREEWEFSGETCLRAMSGGPRTQQHYFPLVFASVHPQ